MKIHRLHEINDCLEVLNREGHIHAENQIIDALTGILWDEEEAGEIKEFRKGEDQPTQ